MIKMVNNSYFEKVKEFQTQLNNLHKKYHKVLKNSDNKLFVYEAKMVELWELENKFSKDKYVFSYIKNDFVKFRKNLQYKINNETLKLWRKK